MAMRAIPLVWMLSASMAFADAGGLQVVQSCAFPLAAAGGRATAYLPDQSYADLGGQDLRYDIATPAAAGKYPLLLLLHGGGFVGGDKTEKFPEAELRMIAAQGYAVATVEYALAGPDAGQGPQSNFPQAIKDLRCAVQYFRSGSDPQLAKIDPARIGVLGTSAGGHLALLLGTAASESSFDDAACPYLAASPAVQAVAAFYPSTRFVTAAGDSWSGYKNVGKQSDFYKIFGTQPGNVVDLIAKGSPLYRVEQAGAAADFPPMLLVNAGKERNPLLTEGVDALAAALSAQGVPHLKITEPKARHGFDPFAAFETSTCTALNFFAKTLGG